MNVMIVKRKITEAVKISYIVIQLRLRCQGSQRRKQRSILANFYKQKSQLTVCIIEFSNIICSRQLHIPSSELTHWVGMKALLNKNVFHV